MRLRIIELKYQLQPVPYAYGVKLKINSIYYKHLRYINTAKSYGTGYSYNVLTLTGFLYY